MLKEFRGVLTSFFPISAATFESTVTLSSKRVTGEHLPRSRDVSFETQFYYHRHVVFLPEPAVDRRVKRRACAR